MLFDIYLVGTFTLLKIILGYVSITVFFTL